MSSVDDLREEFLARAGFGAEVERAVDPADEMLKTIGLRTERPDHVEFDYFRTGADVLHVLRSIQQQLGRPLAELDAVLDFAAGWGRATRFLAAESGADRVHVSDIAAESVTFCERFLGVRGFASALDPGEVEAPCRFDLIFVGSLFTHLPQNRFGPWLEKLLEMLAPGGSLVFTTHGPGLLKAGDRDPSGFTYRASSPIDYLPVSEYASTYVDRGLVHELARAAGARQIQSLERGLWFFHDVNVARKDPAPALEELIRSPICYGRIERAEEVRPGHGWVGGFVCAPLAHGPVKSLELWIDGQRVGPCSNVSAGEAVDALGDPDPEWQRHEFYDEGDISGLAAGEHRVAVLVRQGHHQPFCIDVLPLTVGS